MKCPECSKTTRSTVKCGSCGASLSVPDATLEDLMRSAGAPNLASLFQQAKDDGLIKPVLQYGGPPEGKP